MEILGEEKTKKQKKHGTCQTILLSSLFSPKKTIIFLKKKPLPIGFSRCSFPVVQPSEPGDFHVLVTIRLKGLSRPFGTLQRIGTDVVVVTQGCLHMTSQSAASCRLSNNCQQKKHLSLSLYNIQFATFRNPTLIFFLYIKSHFLCKITSENPPFAHLGCCQHHLGFSSPLEATFLEAMSCDIHSYHPPIIPP